MVDSPWAILLCKFNDNNVEPFPRTFFEEMFTNVGIGKWNIVDYFRDVSHGKMDLSNSKVFGWYTLDKKRSDYTGSGENQQGRQDLYQWARDLAITGQQQPVQNNPITDLDRYAGVLVCMNVATDLFGGQYKKSDGKYQGAVVCDAARETVGGVSGLSPSLLGQEMGHGYGLDHSYMDGSPLPYKDNWDVMSTMQGCFTLVHPIYRNDPYIDSRGNRIIRMGPLLNAANMNSRGWLDEARIWRPGGGDQNIQVTLRPLARPDLPGYLVACVNGYWIEFRIKAGWDGGIPRPAVLIHYFQDNHSYIVTGKNVEDPGLVVAVTRAQDLVPGFHYQVGEPDNPLNPNYAMRIDVVEIDPLGMTATINVRVRHSHQLQAGPASLLIGGAEGGDGVAYVNGKVVRIPPNSPLHRILDNVANIQVSEQINIAAAHDMVRQEALSAIAEVANAEVARLTEYREPGPMQVMSDQTIDSTEGSLDKNPSSTDGVLDSSTVP